MRSGIIAHRDIVLTMPISTNVESSCQTWFRNICAKLATLRSISPRSLANLLIILPVGLVWKNSIGARRIESSMESCSLLAARRLELINQKEFSSVTVTWNRNIEQTFKIWRKCSFLLYSLVFVFPWFYIYSMTIVRVKTK